VTTFLLIRHAAVDGLGERIAGRESGLHLNSEGTLQAVQLAERLARRRITKIYSSPLERARETADPIARAIGIGFHTDDDLSEIDYGNWTGKTFEELERLPGWREYNSKRKAAQIPGGESIGALLQRSIGVIERLRTMHYGEVIAIVSHADWIRTVVAHYTGICLDSFRTFEISPASVSIMRVEDWGVMVDCWNDT
jgi:probable phosphoglycerate mutase